MKKFKRLISLLLAVCLLLGALPLAASAENETLPSGVEGLETIKVTVDDTTPMREITFDEPMQTISTPDTYSPETANDQPITLLGSIGESVSEGYAITERTKFTITNAGTVESAYIRICFEEYVKFPSNAGWLKTDPNDENVKVPLDGLYTNQRMEYPLTVLDKLPEDNNMGYRPSINGLVWMTYPDIWGWSYQPETVKLYPGESISFTLPSRRYTNLESFYRLTVEHCYPDIPWYNWRYYNLVIDEDLATGKDPSPEFSTQFTDVPADAYYAEPVKWAVENNITGGIDETHFGPQASCTRAQAVTFLWNAAGRPEPQGNGNQFTDVKSGSYYEKAVQWAVENNITGGTGNNTFSPDSVCTRAQIVTFLYHAASSPAISGNSSFNDVKFGSYYENAVKWAVENGITSGTGDGRFSPGDNCVRGQIVTFLYNYHN